MLVFEFIEMVFEYLPMEILAVQRVIGWVSATEKRVTQRGQPGLTFVSLHTNWLELSLLGGIQIPNLSIRQDAKASLVARHSGF